MTERQKDKATITPEGESLERRIDGVIVRPARPIEDKRGEVTEVYRPSWGVHPDPLVYVYQTTLRPVDTRTASPTHKHLNQLVFSERNRVLLIIPRGVYHAVQNIGTTEVLFLNMPTRPFNHGDPDKFRLPLKNDLIPFDFSDPPGW